MTFERIKQILIIALLLGLLLALGFAIGFILTLQTETKKLSGIVGIILIDSDRAITNVNRSVDALARYVELQTSVLESPQNQKAIQAAAQAGAIFNATGRLINTQVIPRAMTTIDSLNESAQGLNKLISSTNESLNAVDSGVLAKVGDLTEGLRLASIRLGVTVESVGQAVDQIAEKSSLTLDDIHAIMSSPEWMQVLRNTEQLSANAADLSRSFAEAGKAAPGIATSLEQIAKTSSKYQKALLLASILGILGRAFVP